MASLHKLATTNCVNYPSMFTSITSGSVVSRLTSLDNNHISNTGSGLPCKNVCHTNICVLWQLVSTCHFDLPTLNYVTGIKAVFRCSTLAFHIPLPPASSVSAGNAKDTSSGELFLPLTLTVCRHSFPQHSHCPCQGFLHHYTHSLANFSTLTVTQSSAGVIWACCDVSFPGKDAECCSR